MVDQPVIGNPSPRPVASGVIQNGVTLSTSDNAVRNSSKPLVGSGSGLLVPKVGPSQIPIYFQGPH